MPATPLAYTIVGVFIWLIIRALTGNGGTNDWGQESEGGGGGTRWQTERQREMDELTTRALNAEALLASYRAANAGLRQEIEALEAQLLDD
jgi:hypothetical protein